MALATWRPDVYFGMALNADPNDPLAYPVWADWTARLRRADGYERGTDFELSQPLSAAPRLDLLDVNEDLNPINSSSPYYGLVRPYRATKLLAQWPNPTVAGQVNLFNTGNWKGNKEDLHDGSFEAFVVGTRPTWLAAIGGANPLISTLFPIQGTKNLRYGVSAGTTVQGSSWPVACIPGRQYTASINLLQDVANTHRINVTDQTIAYETFTATAASSWGTAYAGGAWTRRQGNAADFAKGVPGFGGDGVGRMSLPVANVARIQTLAGTLRNGRIWAEFSFDTAPVTTNHQIGVLGRYVDLNNWYFAGANFNADGTVTAFIQKCLAGALSSVASTIVPGLFWTVGERYRVAFDPNVSSLAVRVWRPAADPNAPVAAQASGTDASFAAAGAVGAFGMNTNGALSPNVSWYAFGVQGAVEGSSTTATGTPQRLSVTWTATQPTHTVQLVTEGTVANSTVNVDTIQHEEGAAVSAFTTAGPSIYPVFTGSLEQIPMEWEAGGFSGVRSPPNVDVAANLAKIALATELTQATLNTAPDYYWRLSDGDDSLTFPDSSGNGRPGLVRYISKIGTGTDIEPDTPLSIVGDPGSAGVTFTAVNSGGLGNRPGTALTMEIPNAFPPALAAGLAGNWGITFSCWVQLIANPTGDQHTLITISQGSTPLSVEPLPLCIRVSGTQVDLNLSALVVPTTAIIGSGTVHHIVGQVSSASPVQLALWIDGVKTTGTIAGTFLTATPATSLVLGCRNDGLPFGYAMNGVMTQAALWNRVLTDAEVTSIYQAGAVAGAGETTGARTLRHLISGGYSGPTRITTSGGMTTMQAPSWSGQKDALTDAQENMAAEGGKFWIAPDGYAVAEGRQDRWLRIAPTWTFGEDVASGEIPYLMDSLKINYDALYVYADVLVSRNGGATARGGTLQDIAIAARRYFPGAAGGQFDFQFDAQAQSMANWIFNTHDAPLLRTQAIEIDPVGYPTLWPILLGLELGTRVAFRRRAKAGNAGAGVTISMDFFVEKIGWPTIDLERGIWKYKLQLSTPIMTVAPGAPTGQPWILGDATYGVLNYTTVLGW